MATGAAPFEGTNPYQIMNARLSGDPIAPHKRNPHISPQLEEIILHAMERDPKNRYSKAAEMMAELEAPQTVEVTGRSQRLQMPSAWKSRWHTFRIITWTVLSMFFIFGLILFFFRNH